MKTFGDFVAYVEKNPVALCKTNKIRQKSIFVIKKRFLVMKNYISYTDSFDIVLKILIK